MARVNTPDAAFSVNVCASKCLSVKVELPTACELSLLHDLVITSLHKRKEKFMLSGIQPCHEAWLMEGLGYRLKAKLHLLIGRTMFTALQDNMP